MDSIENTIDNSLNPAPSSPEKEIRKSLSFEARLMYLDSIEKRPLKTVANLFNYTRNDSLKEALFEWQVLAFSTRNENEYTDGIGVAQVVVFFNHLKQLIEVWYWMCYHNPELESLRERKAWEIPTVNFNNGSLQPEQIIANFKEQFSWEYCRSELWYMLEAVMGYRGNAIVPYASMLMKYEQLLCMAKAAYYYPLKPPFEKLKDQSNEKENDIHAAG